MTCDSKLGDAPASHPTINSLNRELTECHSESRLERVAVVVKPEVVL